MIHFEGVLEPGSRDESLLQQIDPQHLPNHLAVIMDGNGRWAKARGKPRAMGHKAGIEAVRATVETCSRLGIGTLTLYTFSVENWKRPRLEVEMLFRLLREALRKEVNLLERNNIRLRFIGRISELDKKVQRELERAEAATRNNSGMTLNLALNYGSRTEIVDAVRRLAAEYHQTGRSMETITEADISRHLLTQSDPDLLIRTSGEMRISNFLLWQIAYTEIYVTETLWPDFGRTHLFEAILSYQKRERRFGGVEPADSEKKAEAQI
ncbi:MAG: isoprenyl transferase [Blastocatellia bacterium]|nr:isoprenyl transferase [Blastocatellia bacterium]